MHSLDLWCMMKMTKQSTCRKVESPLNFELICLSNIFVSGNPPRKWVAQSLFSQIQNQNGHTLIQWKKGSVWCYWLDGVFIIIWGEYPEMQISHHSYVTYHVKDIDLYIQCTAQSSRKLLPNNEKDQGEQVILHLMKESNF